MMRSVRLILHGEPASKANSRRLVTIRGQARLIKSQKALDYVAAVKRTYPPLVPLLEGDLRMTADVYYASRRPDLDVSLILDALQDIAYKNDRQVREMHLYHHLDRENPRAEITLEEMHHDDNE
jgi:Holliday junction resolvase RusA-like endonuclease